MTRTLAAMTLILPMMLALPGCLSTEPAHGRAMMPHLRGPWTLTAIDGRDLPGTFASKPLTLVIELDGKVAGFAGVNRYFGAIDLPLLDAGLFTITGIGATKMAGPPEWMELEAQYLRRLGDADRAIVRNGRLELTEGDEPSLTFRRGGS